MRHFIRHPANVPIEIGPARDASAAPGHSRNVSLGGLALRVACPFDPGTVATLRIPFVRPPFEAQARVAWCLPADDGYELGVEFLAPDDDLRARMVEQVCYIENYRRRVRETEQRELSANEAAREWIHKFGARFFDTE